MTVEKRIEMKESIDTISSVTIELQEASHQNDDKEIPLKLKKDRIKRVKEFVRSTGFKKTARSTLAFMLSVLVCLVRQLMIQDIRSDSLFLVDSANSKGTL